MESGGFVPWDEFVQVRLRCGCPVCMMERVEVISYAGEAIQEAIQRSLDAYRGQDPGSIFREERPEALDQPGDKRLGS